MLVKGRNKVPNITVGTKKKKKKKKTRTKLKPTKINYAAHAKDMSETSHT